MKSLYFVCTWVLLMSFDLPVNSIETGEDRENQNDSIMEMAEKKEHLLKSYASYNRWANERFTEWLKQASEKQFYREVESSFNSLEKTALHLWNAEYGWLQTLKGEPWGDPPGRDFEGSPEELFEGWLNTSGNFENFVRAMSEEELAGDRPLGRDREPSSVEAIVLHVFNHATYHRGQLITMGRQVGLTDPPRTDYIYYIRTHH